MTFMRGKAIQDNRSFIPFDLRVLEESDEEARAWERGVMGNVSLKYMLTGSTPVRWIDVKAYWKEKREHGSFHFGIWVNDKLVGVTGLYDPYELYHSYEFRIMIFGSELIGRGIGKAVTWLVTDYAFRRANSHRVWLGVHEDNVGAIKCYESVGYVKEGLLRDSIYAYGKYSAAVRYSMLRPEWEALCLKAGKKTTGNITD